MVTYPVLTAEMAKRQITKKAVAKRLGICEKTMHNKFNGVTEFTWPETCVIRDTFFPDMSKDELFARASNDNA